MRRYHLIFADEASQIGDDIFKCIIVGVRELPQKPLVVIGADFQQVAPIGGAEIGEDLCSWVHTIELSVVHRTNDPELLAFNFSTVHPAVYPGSANLFRHTPIEAVASCMCQVRIGHTASFRQTFCVAMRYECSCPQSQRSSRGTARSAYYREGHRGAWLSH